MADQAAPPTKVISYAKIVKNKDDEPEEILKNPSDTPSEIEQKQTDPKAEVQEKDQPQQDDADFQTVVNKKDRSERVREKPERFEIFKFIFFKIKNNLHK